MPASAKPARRPTETVPPVAPARPLARPAGRRGRSRGTRAVAPVALGSLTQPGARGSDACAACGSARVTSLSMTLTDGTPVRFTSCHTCEHRSWVSPDGDLDRSSVLQRTRKAR